MLLSALLRAVHVTERVSETEALKSQKRLRWARIRAHCIIAEHFLIEPLLVLQDTGLQQVISVGTLYLVNGKSK